jgi:hypothetical protein
MRKRGGLQCVIETITSDDWVETGKGPWDVAGETELYTYFVIDECHQLIPRTGNVDYRRKFRLWLKTLRHEGCEAVLLTQNKLDFDKDTMLLVSEWVECRSLEDERDPFFGIPLGDWYQIKAAFEGRYSPVMVREELGIGRDGKESSRNRSAIEINPEVYRLYNSYSTERKGARSLRKREPFEKYGRLGVFPWFFFRNLFRIFTGKLAKAIALLLFFKFGVPPLWHEFSNVSKSLMKTGRAVESSADVQAVQETSKGLAAVPLGAISTNQAMVASAAVYTFNGTIKGKGCINGEVFEDINEGLPGAVLRGSILWHDGVPYSPGQRISFGGGSSVSGSLHTFGSRAGVSAEDYDRLRGVSLAGSDSGTGRNARPLGGDS